MLWPDQASHRRGSNRGTGLCTSFLRCPATLSGQATPTGHPSGRTPRTRITGGPDSAKSGAISASQNTYFETTVTGKGTVKFYYKKNAGTNDCFRFKVDGWTKKSVYNSAAPWTQYSYVISSTGSHTLRWQYEKGSSGNSDPTGAWVDRIEWIPNTGSPPSPSLAEGLDTSEDYQLRRRFELLRHQEHLLRLTMDSRITRSITSGFFCVFYRRAVAHGGTHNSKTGKGLCS